MKVFISGLFNRGKENEYVELEAATKCSLEGLMLLRYRYGRNDLPVQSETRVFLFPEINLRKGNVMRVYTFHHNGRKKEKDETIGKTVFNFSWDHDRTIWEGSNIEAHVMQEGNGMGFYPSDPVADSIRHLDERREALLDDHSLLANMMVNALAGNVNIIGEDGNAIPLEVTGMPEEVKAAIEAKDYDKAYALMLAESAK